MGDEGVRNRLGQKLAPHEPWGEWAAALAGKSARKRGGLRSLTMVQRDLDDRQKGHLQARIEPSIKINNDVGIFMEVNDHYEVEDPGQNQGCTEMIDLLEQRFDGSIEKAEWIIDQIMALRESL